MEHLAHFHLVLYVKYMHTFWRTWLGISRKFTFNARAIPTIERDFTLPHWSHSLQTGQDQRALPETRNIGFLFTFHCKAISTGATMCIQCYHLDSARGESMVPGHHKLMPITADQLHIPEFSDWYMIRLSYEKLTWHQDPHSLHKPFLQCPWHCLLRSS